RLRHLAKRLGKQVEWQNIAADHYEKLFDEPTVTRRHPYMDAPWEDREKFEEVCTGDRKK
ncbi:unnamed protein product, partial [Didymodactylos carnosus]